VAYRVSNAYYRAHGSIPCSESMPGRIGDSFSSAVIMRILRILLENGEMKKSNLCSRAGMNYKVCTRYIDFLARLGWVEIKKAGSRGMVIAIPSEGISTLRKLELKEEKMDSSGIIKPVSPTVNSPHSCNKSHLDNNIQKVTNSNTRRYNRNDQSAIMTSKNDEKIGSSNNKGSTTRSRKKIVIIDDDENALFTYSSFLENDKSLKVLTFSDPRKALEYLTTHPNSADLILLDIRMPGMSGLRVYQGVKALDPRANIIFLSSLDAAPELGDLLSNATLDDSRFLRKPVRRHDFIQAVQKAIS
jgi:CheY-like chemotaxis protein